jgi:hypothetical protein
VSVIFLSCFRVARWCVSKPEIQIWANFGGSCNGRCWYIFGTLGPFYGPFVYFMDLWYIGIGVIWCRSPFWYFIPRKIWQPWAASLSFLMESRPAKVDHESNTRQSTRVKSGKVKDDLKFSSRWRFINNNLTSKIYLFNFKLSMWVQGSILRPLFMANLAQFSAKKLALVLKNTAMILFLHKYIAVNWVKVAKFSSNYLTIILKKWKQLSQVANTDHICGSAISRIGA